MIESIQHLLANNAFFSGGAMLAILGGLALWLRKVPVLVFEWAKRYFITKLSFDSRDELMFRTIVEYMHTHQAFSRINHFTVRTVRQGHDYQELADELTQGGKPQAYLSPGEGFHILKVDGHWMWMTREVQVADTILEKISLSMFGRDKAPLQAFIDAAIDLRVSRELNKISILIPSSYNNEWVRAKLGNNRKLSSVVLKAGQTEAILQDLNQFFAAKQRYDELGIPWRRGYLLYGPPGTGKTSLVTALASQMSLNVCAISLASPNITDERINNLLSTVPPRSIILLEDIDSFFRQREKADASVKLSYSGFINALDGVASHEGSVVFLTTNHPELLDEAAIRSGRVDFRMELSRCDRHQLYQMALKFDANAAQAQLFANQLEEARFSPAQVQEALLKSSTLENAVGYLQQLSFKEIKLKEVAH